MRTIALLSLASVASLASAVTLGGCITDKKPITGTASLKIDLVSPADPGSISTRLDDAARTTVVNITAINEQGDVDTTFNNDLQVYVHFLGTLTPYLGKTPLATIHMANGKATNQTISLPPVFGPTEIWFDDGADANPTYATGNSTTLWYRDPVIEDIQRPTSETSLDAGASSPLNNKNVQIQASKYGASGKLVVTSVFSQGYTLADVQCGSGGACNGSNYDTVEVFSYSAPLDNHGAVVTEGEVIDGFAGGVSLFDGLVEIGFPQTFTSTTPANNKAFEPAPWKVDASWFSNTILFKRAQAAAVELDGATVCAIDSAYAQYSEWKVSLDGSCSGQIIDIVSTGVSTLDPTMCTGKVIPKIVGLLRPVALYSIWIIYPRSNDDFQLTPGDAQCKF